MKTIYLHIGTPKTATTSIQTYLTKNRKTLKNNNLLYPESNHLQHLDLAVEFGLNNSKKNINTISKEKTKKEIDDFINGDIIISSEMFSKSKSKELQAIKEFFKDYKVVIIVYLRKHDEFYISLFQQAIKTNSKLPWNSFKDYIEFSKNRKLPFLKYKSLLDSWENYFGFENIIIRPFEKKQIKNNIIIDFFSSIGKQNLINNTNLDLEVKNKSLDAITLKIIEKVKKDDSFNNEKKEKIKKFAIRKINSSFKASIFSSLELNQKIIDENIEDYNYIAKKYLKRDELFFDINPNNPLKEFENFERLIEEVIDNSFNICHILDK